MSDSVVVGVIGDVAEAAVHIAAAFRPVRRRRLNDVHEAEEEETACLLRACVEPGSSSGMGGAGVGRGCGGDTYAQHQQLQPQPQLLPLQPPPPLRPPPPRLSPAGSHLTRPESQLVDEVPVLPFSAKHLAVARCASREDAVQQCFEALNTVRSKYSVTGYLARGTYGTVFVGQDRTSGEDVVIKVMLSEAPENGSFNNSARELRALALMQGPGVVPLLHVGITQQFAVAMVLPRYTCTFSHLDRSSAGLVRAAFARLARAVHRTHCAGFTHRDLKPENVFVRGTDVVIGDWGLARDGATALASDKALTHEVVSLWYASPEVLCGDQGYDAELVDTWSLGVMLLELGLDPAVFATRQKELNCRRPDFVWRYIVPYMLGDDLDDEDMQYLRVLMGPRCKGFEAAKTALRMKDLAAQTRTLSLMAQLRAYHGADAPIVSLVTGLLQVQPKKRFTAAQVLAHPYVAECLLGKEDGPEGPELVRPTFVLPRSHGPRLWPAGMLPPLPSCVLPSAWCTGFSPCAFVDVDVDVDGPLPLLAVALPATPKELLAIFECLMEHTGERAWDCWLFAGVLARAAARAGISQLGRPRWLLGLGCVALAVQTQGVAYVAVRDVMVPRLVSGPEFPLVMDMQLDIVRALRGLAVPKCQWTSAYRQPVLNRMCRAMCFPDKLEAAGISSPAVLAALCDSSFDTVRKWVLLETMEPASRSALSSAVPVV